MSVYGNNCLITSILLPVSIEVSRLERELRDLQTRLESSRSMEADARKVCTSYEVSHSLK